MSVSSLKDVKAFLSVMADLRDKNPKEKTPLENERNEAKFQRQAQTNKSIRNKARQLEAWY